MYFTLFRFDKTLDTQEIRFYIHDTQEIKLWASACNALVLVDEFLESERTITFQFAREHGTKHQADPWQEVHEHMHTTHQHTTHQHSVKVSARQQVWLMLHLTLQNPLCHPHSTDRRTLKTLLSKHNNLPPTRRWPPPISNQALFETKSIAYSRWESTTIWGIHDGKL